MLANFALPNSHVDVAKRCPTHRVHEVLDLLWRRMREHVNDVLNNHIGARGDIQKCACAMYALYGARQHCTTQQVNGAYLTVIEI